MHSLQWFLSPYFPTSWTFCVHCICKPEHTSCFLIIDFATSLHWRFVPAAKCCRVLTSSQNVYLIFLTPWIMGILQKRKHITSVNFWTFVALLLQSATAVVSSTSSEKFACHHCGLQSGCSLHTFVAFHVKSGHYTILTILAIHIIRLNL